MAFYTRLRFQGHMAGDACAIVTRGGLEIHFFSHPTLVPEESFAGCYARVANVVALYESLAAAELPRTGIPGMEVLEDKPRG